MSRVHHEQFYRALEKNDLKKLSEVYADDYMLVRPDGSVLSKTQVLADLEAHAMVFKSIELTNEKIRGYGPVAILTGDSRVVTVRDGTQSSIRSRLVAVYAEKDRRIELVHFQSSFLPE